MRKPISTVACPPAAEAHAAAAQAFQRLLPDGVATPNQHVLVIYAGAPEQAVGTLWFAIEPERHPVAAFVYDLKIAPEHRRRGYAKAAFLAMEPMAQALGAHSIGLHVFGYNDGAKALYTSLGYGVTGVNMRKQLAG